MVRLDRIVTRGGDKGTTSLVGGQRVPKDAARLETYGTVDEMNAVIGLARAFNADGAERFPVAAARIDRDLRRIQNLLFDLGSDLATPLESRFAGQPVIREEDVLELDALAAELNAELPPLDSFVLPGGGKVSGFLHQARTVCRRAERRIMALQRAEPIGEWVIPFVNRLSDVLFVMARYSSRALGETEYLWRK